ncbi:MAG TPA: DUF2917 domain-containing protein [Noviherbaspirillum sp.]|uniref:DUF2917 domain-containing protein n=1 Tax=Noviherbaspirillum sp. TaxID=1926288 RepID=UPI002D241FCF|nr:DUF2917 domain-containing protein [Noviherbaspirillum sp.]HYD97682.1 DUF2917 domain-containing protein [Noviherbaspirillum sp.]
MQANAHKARAPIAHFARRHSGGTVSDAAMELNPAGDTLLLRGSQHLRLEHAHGWTVRALAGAVWIVQDGDIRDIVLEAGDSVLLDRDAPATFSAFGEARLCIARDANRCQPQRVIPAAPALPASAEPAFA